METENIIPGLDFPFQLHFPILWEHIKESYGLYIAHITQGTDMYKIPYSEQAWQNIYCSLSSNVLHCCISNMHGN